MYSLLIVSIRFITFPLTTLNCSYIQEIFKDMKAGEENISDYFALFTPVSFPIPGVFLAKTRICPLYLSLYFLCHFDLSEIHIYIYIFIFIYIYIYISLWQYVVEENRPWTQQPRNLDLSPSFTTVSNEAWSSFQLSPIACYRLCSFLGSCFLWFRRTWYRLKLIPELRTKVFLGLTFLAVHACLPHTPAVPSTSLEAFPPWLSFFF